MAGRLTLRRETIEDLAVPADEAAGVRGAGGASDLFACLLGALFNKTPTSGISIGGCEAQRRFFGDRFAVPAKKRFVDSYGCDPANMPVEKPLIRQVFKRSS
jgi:hypothetical protein